MERRSPKAAATVLERLAPAGSDLPAGAFRRSPASPSMSSFDRELFPLPAPFPLRIDPWSSDAHGRPVRSLARSVQRRLFKREHLESWCNDGTQTLSELSGAPYNVLAPHSKNNGQDVCVSHLQRVYSGVPKPPLEFTPAGAFIELCGSASRYDPASASETSVAPTRTWCPGPRLAASRPPCSPTFPGRL